MGRSLALFRAQGIDPIPSVSAMRSEHLPPPSLIVPSAGPLIISDEALYDYMAAGFDRVFVRSAYSSYFSQRVVGRRIGFAG